MEAARVAAVRARAEAAAEKARAATSIQRRYRGRSKQLQLNLRLTLKAVPEGERASAREGGLPHSKEGHRSPPHQLSPRSELVPVRHVEEEARGASGVAGAATTAATTEEP